MNTQGRHASTTTGSAANRGGSVTRVVVAARFGGHLTMERPSRTSTLIAAVIVVLLLPIVTNVAAGVLPTLLHPYLWLAWPVAGLLTIPVVVSEVRRRRSQRE